MKAEAYGHIENGELKIVNRKRFIADLQEFKNVDVVITVKKKGKRSSQANRFYWGTVLKSICIELKRLGNRVDIETLHEFFKEKYNPIYIFNEEGEVVGNVGGSTTELNKSEFSEYLERIIEWANTSLGIIINEPGGQSQIFNDYEIH